MTNGGRKFPGTVNVYPADGNANIAPIAIIAGLKTELSSPTGIALDSKGQIYVTNASKVPSFSAVEVYPVGSNGDVAPIATIRGNRTGLTNPQGVTLGANGDIYVTDDPVLPSSLEYDSVVYRPGSNGNIAPIVLIRGNMTGLNWPEGISLDLSGNIYVVNSGPWNTYPGTVTVYPPARSGNVKPLTTIRGGPDTGISRPTSVALDSDGNIYVGNLDSSVTIYPAGTRSNVRPGATIKGPNTRLCPSAIAVDSKRNVYVVNKFQAALGDPFRSQANLSVTTYLAGSDGNVAPATVISGRRTGLRSVNGIAVDSRKNIYVANFGDEFFDKGGLWAYRRGSSGVDVYRAGSNGDVTPIATIAGPHTGIDFSKSLGLGLGIALDSRGRIYVLSENTDASQEIDRITVYPALGKRAGSLDEAPIATIEGSNTELWTAEGIAVLGPKAPTREHPPIDK